jgi:hypothetical protein
MIKRAIEMLLSQIHRSGPDYWPHTFRFFSSVQCFGFHIPLAVHSPEKAIFVTRFFHRETFKYFHSKQSDYSTAKANHKDG